MTTIAHLMLRFAGHIVPEHRRDWIEAMQAELGHIAESNASRFAAGCLVAALHERAVHTFRNGTAAAKVVCLGACAVLALLGCANAARLSQEDTALGVVFTLSSAIWSAAFIATVFKSWRRLALVAIGGLLASAACAVGTIVAVAAMEPNSPLIWAVSEEGVALFGALLAAAHTFRRKRRIAS